MTFLQKWARLLQAATLTAFVAGGLAACGGGGGTSGTPVNGGSGGSGSGPAVADISVVLSKTTMANDGSETLTLTATALDSNRGGIEAAKLTVGITDPNNSVFSSASTLTTDSSGKGTATISLGSDRSIRTVTVNVANGSITKSATFNVVQTTQPTTEAAEITLALDKYTASNSGTDTVVATVTAVDANRNVLAGVPVAFSINNNATVAVVNGTTNSAGKAIANAQIGSDKANRIVTITASSGTLTKTASFQVSGAKLTASAVPSIPAAGSTGNAVQYRLSDTNDNAIPGQTITVSAPGLAAVTGTTDNSGAYTYTYTAPTTPGAYAITAVGGGVTTVTTVTIPTGSSTIPAVTTTVSSATFTANPSVVTVNTSGSTANRAELRALFQAADNSPIKNIRVRFDMNGDTTTGGTIGSGTSLVYSDESGYATTSYYPGTRSTGTNGLVLRACWDYADFASTACPNSKTVALTLVSNPLAISIGTDATLSEGPDLLTYIKRFVVLVVDASGAPVSGVDIVPSIDLVNYYKGFYSAGTSAWTSFHYVNTTNTTAAGRVACLNEDLDRDGLLDTGEDRNGNGTLEPRKSDVAIKITSSSSKTDASGQVVLQIEYAKSFSTWLDYRISVSATGVVSPPATYFGNLTAFATDFSTVSTSPAFQFSPYGRVQLSTDTVGGFCTSPN